ncbi:MAG: DUF2085 domain-containing protein [Anaerolineales bacterium]
MQPISQQEAHSPLTVFLVLVAALGIIGAWTIYTQPGVLGKADAVGYAICHRIPERTFEAFGRELPLCARCTGIYLGVMTGLGVFVASGRARAARLPGWRVGLVLASFVAVLGLDGLNSYFSLFPGYTGPYETQNWMRVTTGIFTGLTLINLVFPIFNQSVWADGGQPIRAVANLKELGGLMVLAVLVLLLVFSQNATLLLFFGVISAVGVVSVLTMVFTVMVIALLNRYQAYSTWRGLAVPLLAGLTLAITMIGIIDYLRFMFTGTWDGFSF